MVKVNENFLKLPGSYLFSEVARRIRVYNEANPQASIITKGFPQGETQSVGKAFL